MSDLSRYRFTVPSFFEGAARLMDFGNSLADPQSTQSPEETDQAAIASDWIVVGMDLRKSMQQESALANQLLRSRHGNQLLSTETGK